jgi:hypothetical protein
MLRISSVQEADKSLLMRSAISVVLRKDLSLTRRLYAWLLGPGEAGEAQEIYFKSNALHLLCQVLKV